ncbi:NAD-dependent epimerase/dehydratase family protein [Granulicella sp. 5B5]|uniref:NAD-dependent epimerase/dehydratase family protein n=1 Tax=Granulicella sp. 5B5 TaxID=1617967 RepID=UPI0015F4FC6F|nr:NAD-dependent epimerase/dehydratase family protein [Granulicella sp. 5B5]QMV17359.1 NAD-dependent epimerase/dehydratase family protein [Granulicella sp. 5B5]
MPLKIILTGATGLVGEGVLLECLQNPAIEQVLIVNRKHFDLAHPKLRELLVPDFMHLEAVTDQLSGYDACFYCAGISSAGMSEPDYTHITYDITLHFAATLLALNPQMTFCFISGAQTDSTEKGRIMWARVKGRTENALATLGFAHEVNLRPGFMKPMPGQRNVRSYYRIFAALFPVLIKLFPNQGCTLQDLARAMIHTALTGAPKPILENKDIKALATS